MVFPNVVVGIAPKVLSLEDCHPDINLICGLEPNQLLLETDAPTSASDVTTIERGPITGICGGPADGRVAQLYSWYGPSG